MSADNSHFESDFVITFTRSGSLSHSAAPTTIATSDHHHHFLTFLGIAQSLNIDFLPITWQPKLDRAGRGGTAEILQTLIMLQTNYAFKRLMHSLPAKKTESFTALIAEIAVLGHPSIRGHNHIAALEGICWDIDSETEKVWPVLVFGKAQYGDLVTFMELGEGKMLSLKDRLKLCIDMVTGVMDMHSSSIIHGDIKPQNVLIYSNGSGGYVAKIADFGYSTIFADKDSAIRMPGSPYWVAPEWHHRNYTTDVTGAKKMDAYSFGALCLWLLFYNNHETTSSKFYEDLRSKTSMSVLVSDHLAAAFDLDNQSRNILHQVFNRTLQQDAKDRTSDFTELFGLLSTLGAENNQVPKVVGPNIRLPSGTFQVVPSMAQLLLADFRVRTYIAECLKKFVFETSYPPRSQNFALELAFCYKVGFGVAKDKEASDSLLRRSGYHSEELDRRISSIREGPGLPQFRDSAYCLFVERGYDMRIDFVEHYRADQELGVVISQYKREIVDLENVLGPDHPMTQILKTQLCHILRGAGYQREAGELREQVTETLKRVRGGDDLGTLSSMANLAAIYSDQGRWKEAEKIQTQVLKTQTSLLGTKHPDVLESLGVLSIIYRSQGRFKEAKELQLQAVQIREAILGQEHPDTLRSKASLASIYLVQRQLDEAEQLLVSVMRTRKVVLGEKHSDTLSSVENLATCYHYQGRLKESEELRSRILEIKEEVLGKDHPDTLLSISNLASTRKDLGWLEKAETLEEQLIGARSRVLGKDHPSTLTTLGNLALTYGLQKRWEKAVDLGKTVVDLKTRGLGQNHPSTVASMANLADAYKGLGQLQEAGELLVQAVRNSVAVLGTEHPTSIAAMSRLISLRKEQGQWEESNDLDA